MKVKLTFTEEALGTASANPALHSEYIASNAPDAKSKKEEVEALGTDEVEKKAMTIFPRTEDGVPFIWDYQIKGFFKDACSMKRRVPKSLSSKLTAHKKIIDGLIFVDERRIPLMMPAGKKVGNCQRPLRAQTAQGERVALANSETVPIGTTIEFNINILDKGHEKVVQEWLDYGILRGLLQWRNSGKGRFSWAMVT